MIGPAFTALVRGRIHECAPDHSVETISVGELRKAAATMAELYEALHDAATWIGTLDSPYPPELGKKIRGALCGARGEA